MDGTTTTATTGTPTHNFFHTTTPSSGMGNMWPMMMGSGWGGGAGAGAGAGLGAGLLGGVLAGALFGNGGLGGNNDNRNFVTTADLNSALNGQTAGQNTNAILQSLATIQQLIPENEGKVQLALAQAQIALQNQATQGQLQVAAVNTNLAGTIDSARANIDTNIRNAQDTTINGFASVNANLAMVNNATQLGIANLGLQTAQQTAVLQTTIRDDGDKTRALIIAQNDAELNRIITTQANKIIELQGDRNTAASGLTITQTVNQAQAQAQQQQQQQQQLILLSQIATGLANVTQIAHATNSNVIAGNTGAVTSGPQTASPTNVNA